MSNAEPTVGSDERRTNPTSLTSETTPAEQPQAEPLSPTKRHEKELADPKDAIPRKDDTAGPEGSDAATPDAVANELKHLQVVEKEPAQYSQDQDHTHGGEDSLGVYEGIEALGSTPTPSHGNTSRQETHGSTSEDTQDPNPSAVPDVTSGSKHDSTHGDTSASKESATAGDTEDDSRSEIQSIMEQFEGQDEEELGQQQGSPQSGEGMVHPPRQSSLEPQHSGSPVSGRSHQFPAVSSPVRPPSLRNFSQIGRVTSNDSNSASSPLQSPALNKALPPAPDPEPALPFDFHRFLEQLRHRTADSVAKYLRSFLLEFGKKQWMVHEQIKIISDFLAFIANKMAQCEIWRGVSDAEFDNAREGMEKLVMNRLYSQTFSPAIPAPTPASPQRGRKNVPRPPGPGRRGQHQEDVERDDVLGQKVRIYGWVREEHLDIAPVGKTGQRFLSRAQQELLKINSYRAPRDKVICVLNCCKVIFGFLKTSKEADTSADAFVPLLIYVILRSNPEHLVSNVQYISRFRNPDRLGGEAGYYLSSLMGAVQFIENLDRTALTISDEDFEKNVEAAVSAIAERKSFEGVPADSASNPRLQLPRDAEKDPHSPRTSTEQQLRPSNLDPSSSSGPGDQTPVAGLLKTIQKPLSSIGRMFSEDAPGDGPERPSHRSTHSVDGRQRLSPSVAQPPRRSSSDAGPTGRSDASESGREKSTTSADVRQASLESAEAHRIQRAEHRDVVETLAGMFPNLDRDVISDVVRMKEGRRDGNCTWTFTDPVGAVDEGASCAASA